MKDSPADLHTRYTPSHEWARRAEGEHEYWEIGITSFAAEHLGEIVFIETPPPRSPLNKGDVMCVLESVKAASELYSPCDCVIIESNTLLLENISCINEHPESNGWIIRVSPKKVSQLQELLTPPQYQKLIAQR